MVFCSLDQVETSAPFENEIDLSSSSRSMSIGRNVYFKIIWDIGLTLASPVVFYAQNCRVSERKDDPEAERKHYDIIFNGRGSRLTSTKLRSPSVFAKRELRFSFRHRFKNFSSGKINQNLKVISRLKIVCIRPGNRRIQYGHFLQH